MSPVGTCPSVKLNQTGIGIPNELAARMCCQRTIKTALEMPPCECQLLTIRVSGGANCK